MNRRCVLVALPACLTSILKGQTRPNPLTGSIELPPPPPGPGEIDLTSTVELVLLDVSVKDPEGGYVSSLQKSDFAVFENNKPQEITTFASGDIPVTVGLVIDNSASVRKKRPEIITSALTFVQASKPQDEIFIVNFNDRVQFGLPKEVPFTGDRQLLRHALLTSRAQGRTALHDGIRAALEHLQKGNQDKKTLIVISDGGDNASELTEDEMLQLAGESTATIYTVGIFDPDAKDKNIGFLRDLSKVTGGETFLPAEISELVGVCERIAKDIRNRYTIGYAPKNLTFDGKPRKLKVIARSPDRRKLTVRTRSQYIATPRSAWRSRRTK